MATKYPDGIDNTTSLPYITNGTSPMVAEDINRLRDAVVAVETELGADPSGTFTSVAARVAANEQAISEYARSEFLVLSHDGYVSRERVFTPSADFVATDGGPGLNYELDLAAVVGIGTSTPDAGYSLTLDGDGSSRIGGIVLRDAGTDTFFIGSPAAGNVADIALVNPNSGYLSIESGGAVNVDGAAVAIDSVGAVEVQGATVEIDSSGLMTIGAASSAVEIGSAGADTSVLGDLVVEENIDVTSGKITFSSDLSIGSYPAGFAGFGAPLPLPYSVVDSASSIIVNTQNEELLLTTNLSGIFGLNTDDWMLLGLDNGRTVATNKYGGIGGPTSSATMFSAVAPFGVVGTMVMGSADPDDGFGSAIESAENLAIAALGDTALLLANNSSGAARVKIGAIDGSGPSSTDDWSTKYGDSSVHVTKIADFVYDGSAQIQVATGGGAAAPEYSFSGAENTGVFYSAPGAVSVSADGLEVLRAVNSASTKKVIIGPEEDDSAVESIVAATSRPDGGTADSVGAHLYLRAGAGLGTGQGGSVILQVAPPDSVSGQSQNAFSNILMANANSAAAPRYLGIDASVVTLNGPVANNTSVNIGTQASASGVTKLINIGTGGLSGSTTEISMGVSGDASVVLNTSDRDISIGAGDDVSIGAGDSASVTSGRAIILDATTEVEIITFEGSSGTVSAATSITVSDSTASWAINQWAGWSVSIIDGAGSRQSRSIISNTASALTISPAWTVIPSVLSNFAIKRGGLALNIGSDISINSVYGNISIDADAGYVSLVAGAADDLAIQVNAENGGINVASPDITIQSSLLTANSTLNLGAHAATAGMKTINIGTGGTGSASTAVNIGSASAPGFTTVNGQLSCTDTLEVGGSIIVSEIEASGAGGTLLINGKTGGDSFYVRGTTDTEILAREFRAVRGLSQDDGATRLLKGGQLLPDVSVDAWSLGEHAGVARLRPGAILLPTSSGSRLVSWVTDLTRALDPGTSSPSGSPRTDIAGNASTANSETPWFFFVRMKAGDVSPQLRHSMTPPSATGFPAATTEPGYAVSDYAYVGMLVPSGVSFTTGAPINKSEVMSSLWKGCRVIQTGSTRRIMWPGTDMGVIGLPSMLTPKLNETRTTQLISAAQMTGPNGIFSAAKAVGVGFNFAYQVSAGVGAGSGKIDFVAPGFKFVDSGFTLTAGTSSFQVMGTSHVPVEGGTPVAANLTMRVLALPSGSSMGTITIQTPSGKAIVYVDEDVNDVNKLNQTPANVYDANTGDI